MIMLTIPVRLSAFAPVTLSYKFTNGLPQELNPDPKNPPTLDPKDLFLLDDLPVSHVNEGRSEAGSSTPAVTHVPWLRKTEYLSRERVQRYPAPERYGFAYLGRPFISLTTHSVNRKPVLPDA